MKTIALTIMASLISLATPTHAQVAMPDTVAAAVVQRFVDAANARQLDNMMATVAPRAMFSMLPDNEVIAWVVSQPRAGRLQVSAQEPVPMHQEPRHRLVLTHQQVRVMDVKIRPGDTTLFHVHDVPALFVAVSTAPVDIQLLNGAWGGTHPAADPGRKPGDVNADTAYVRQPITHRVTNVGSQLFNLIAITSSTVLPGDAGSPEIPGALELQNRWFTQSRIGLTATTARRWYLAASPTIVVQPLPGLATVLLQSGDKHALNTPGSWALIPAGTRYQLSSPSSATLVVVQIR